MWIYTRADLGAPAHAVGPCCICSRVADTRGASAIAVLIASCTLNLALGTLTLWRPSPWLYAMQSGAVLGYGLTAGVQHAGADARPLRAAGEETCRC